MAWRTMDVEEQKVKFVVAATRREKSLTALCQEFGISRPTGCLWRKRYQEAGLAGIAERSRRPRQSPDRTSAELERRVDRSPAPSFHSAGTIFGSTFRTRLYGLPRRPLPVESACDAILPQFPHSQIASARCCERIQEMERGKTSGRRQ
jgi:transposase-like protein